LQTGTINGLTGTTFNTFGPRKGIFLYQAPEKIAQNMAAVIKAKGTNQAGKNIIGEKQIIIAKGILNVSYAGQIIFGTNTTQTTTI